MSALRAAAKPAPHPQRDRLIASLRASGVRDEAVLTAMARIPREQFLEGAWAARAYVNDALPIGHAQTLSQPLVVAHMTDVLLQGKKLKKVLEIGTGSGYQAAVLAELVDTVFTVERIRALSESARARLSRLGYKNIHFGYADGTAGWLPYAPYDGILVTAGATELPRGLTDQLAPGGRLVIPVGAAGQQTLRLIERHARGLKEINLGAVSFVPLLGGKV